jgi:transmembrane protein 33
MKSSQPKALHAVSFLEVYALLPSLLLSVVTLRSSIFSLLIFIQFLRFRYFFSPLTRQAVGDLKRRCDEVVLKEDGKVPIWAVAIYKRIVELIVRFGDVGGNTVGDGDSTSTSTPSTSSTTGASSSN